MSGTTKVIEENNHRSRMSGKEFENKKGMAQYPVGRECVFEVSYARMRRA